MIQSDELLSAIHDGECNRNELDSFLKECAASPRLLERYSRMCMVSETIRGSVAPLDARFCDRVMSQLGEPLAKASGRNVVTFPQPSVAPRRTRRRGLVAAGGLALAASVGVLATVAALKVGVVSAPGFVTAPGASSMSAQLQGPASGSAFNQQVALRSFGDASNQQSTGSSNMTTANPAHASMVRWTQLKPAAARQLDDYLMEHASYPGAGGMGGALSYARVAAHAVSYQTDNSYP